MKRRFLALVLFDVPGDVGAKGDELSVCSITLNEVGVRRDPMQVVGRVQSTARDWDLVIDLSITGKSLASISASPSLIVPGTREYGTYLIVVIT